MDWFKKINFVAVKIRKTISEN